MCAYTSALLCAVQICCNDQVSVGNACCGSTGYDNRKAQCCAGTVAYKSDVYSQCCGQTSFNPARQVSGVSCVFTHV
jgi:hypothetical protein